MRFPCSSNSLTKDERWSCTNKSPHVKPFWNCLFGVVFFFFKFPCRFARMIYTRAYRCKKIWNMLIFLGTFFKELYVAREKNLLNSKYHSITLYPSHGILITQFHKFLSNCNLGGGLWWDSDYLIQRPESIAMIFRAPNTHSFNMGKHLNKGP